MFQSRTKEARKIERKKYNNSIVLYRQQHKLEAREYAKKYRQNRKSKGFPNGIASKWFKKISDRDGAVCKHCLTKEDLSINHIVPKCIGGEYSYENLEILCRRCNVKEYHRLVQKALKKYFSKTTSEG